MLLLVFLKIVHSYDVSKVHAQCFYSTTTISSASVKDIVIISDAEVSMTVVADVASSSQSTAIVPTLSFVVYGSNDVNDRLSVSEVSSDDYVNATSINIQIAATPQIQSTFPGSSGNAGTMIFFSTGSQTASSNLLFVCFAWSRPHALHG